ncbi:hypothetical protein KEM56_001066 [Ascosphaera pollenicola]|nr:hypothetical protein KEM56_001066 [Ascosphaera pollenicola]
MVSKQPTPPLEASSPSDGGVRKRVCKACDRCRLKKSKCDGANPCGRCRSDNAICVFGERKKAHDKVYPKGYVEMLEQQQSQLVAGLQELYRRTREGQGWPGEPLQDMPNGHPLTHDILERLGALKPAKGSDEIPTFEEDLNHVQRKLIASGAGFMPRDSTSDFGSEGAPSPTIPTSNPFGVSEITYPTSGIMSFPPTPPLYIPPTARKRLTPTQQAQLSAAQSRVFAVTNGHNSMQSPPTSAGLASSFDCHTRDLTVKSPRKRAATMDHPTPCPPTPLFFNQSAMNPDLLRTSAPAPTMPASTTHSFKASAPPLTPLSISPNSTTGLTGSLTSPQEPLMNAGMHQTNLDDCVAFIDSFDAYNVFSPASTYSGLPDWNEDEELKLFLDPSPQMI